MTLYKIIFCIFIALSMTSCSKKTHENEGDNETPDKKGQSELSYTIQNLYDLTQFLDVEATYTDINGESTTTKVESLPWKVLIKDFAKEQEVKLQLSFTRKEGVESTKKSYAFGADITIAYRDTNGSLTDSNKSGSVDCPASNLEEALQHYVDAGMEYKFSVEIP